MPDKDDQKLKGHIKADTARRDRLAAELRANLKKRKERVRALSKAERGRQEPDKHED